MKKFITGFVLGAMIFGSLGAFAVQYVANPVSFKVMVNGKEFVSDPPALEVEGRTYLPLRAMGEALGVPVNWNEELRQAEVGTAPVVNTGTTYSRTNPAPLNTMQTYVKNEKYSESNYTANLRITEVIRGNKAWEIIKEDNMFNEEPEAGYEYIIAKVAFSLIASQEDKAVNANSYDFDFYSSNNEEYDKPVVVLENKLDTNMFVGGNCEGYIVSAVKKDDVNPKVAYGLNYDGTGGIWFALY